MSLAAYAAFLPSARRAALVPPEVDGWEWRGHRVRLLRARDPEAGARLLVVHGAGAHGEALWPVASLLIGRGLDITAVDLPLYGGTVTRRRSRVRYEDWIELLVDLVAAEDDGRPVFLLGGSIGGLLAVEAAARLARTVRDMQRAGGQDPVAAVAATCLLDPQDRAARVRMTRFGRLGLRFMPLLGLVRGPLGRIPIRVSWVARLSRMGRSPALGRLCAADPQGGGAWVPLGFLTSYMTHRHPAARSVPVPVHLIHPERDGWTPLALSTATLDRLPGPTRTTVLRECGHFPLEEPGLTDLVDVVEAMVREHS